MNNEAIYMNLKEIQQLAIPKNDKYNLQKSLEKDVMKLVETDKRYKQYRNKIRGIWVEIRDESFGVYPSGICDYCGEDHKGTACPY